MGLGDSDHPVSMWMPTPYVSCGHGDRETFFMTVAFPHDGQVVSFGGRFCRPCGAEVCVSIPQDAGGINVQIIDWDHPDNIIVHVYPKSTEEVDAA